MLLVRRWIAPAALVAVGALSGFFVGFVTWGRSTNAAAFARSYADGERVRVARVVDGDTIILEDGMHVRYRGCDTPETFRFVRDPEPFADLASERNRELVEGAWVRLRFPSRGMPALDAHGRLLADVRLDGENWMRSATVAEQIIRSGLAEASSFELERSEAECVRAAEAAAREAKVGMWRPEPAAQTERYTASRRGKMIHRATCSYAQRINERNRLFFNTLEAALAASRKPCPACMGRLEASGDVSPRARPK
jgi:micrococcal nuclease